MTVTCRPALASPAVHRDPTSPGASEIVLTGVVADPGGLPVAGAVIDVHGVALRAAEDGTYELLLELAEPAPLRYRLTAPGFAPLDRTVPLLPAAILADGTPVVWLDFALSPEAA